MKRITLAVVLLIIAAGSWVYVTRPASKPAPESPVTQVPHTPALLLEAEAQDRKDAQKAAKLTPAQIAAIKRKSGQTEVRGMVKIRQDAFPVTFVAGLDPAHSSNPVCSNEVLSGEAQLSKNGELVSDTTGWSFNSDGVISGPSSPATGVYTLTYGSTQTCTLDGGGDGVTTYYYTFTVTGDLTGSASITNYDTKPGSTTISLHLKADAGNGNNVASAVITWQDGTTTTINPGVQHYEADVLHTYTADPGTGYGFSPGPTVVYTDDVTPTPNTVTITIGGEICVLSQEIYDVQTSIWNTVQLNPGLLLGLTGTTYDTSTGIYTKCYKAALAPDYKNPYQSVAQPNLWTDPIVYLPENATITNDGGWPVNLGTPDSSIAGSSGTGSGGIVEFCIPSTTNDAGLDQGQVMFLTDSIEQTCPYFAWQMGFTNFDFNLLGYYYSFSSGNEIPVPTGCIADTTHVNLNYPTLPAGYDASVDVQQRQTDTSFVDIGSITADGSLEFDAAQPKIFRFVATKTSDSSAVYSLTATIDTDCESGGEGCDDGFHDDGTGNCLNDDDGATACASGYHWSGTACISNTPATAIPAPNVCVNSVADDGTATLVSQPLTGIPSDATSAVLQHWNGTSYDDVKTFTLSEVATIFLYNLNPATILQFLWKLTTNDAGFQYFSDSFTVTETCCEGGGGGSDLTPDVPDAPTAVKSCADGTATVSVVLPAGATSIEIARDDAENTVIGTLTASGDYVDSNVADFGTYKYRARAKNLFASDWSDWSNEVSFVSETLTITWLSPAANYTAHGKVLLKLSAVGTLTGLQLYVGNTLVTPGLQSKGGGIYSLSYDTRRAVQGATTIEARAVGSDGCPAKATLNLTLENTRSDGVLYRDFKTDTQEDGYQINRFPVLLITGELDDDPTAQFWGQMAITKDTTVPIVTSETDPADAQAAFDAMQPFPLNTKKTWPAMGGNDGGSMLANAQTVIAPGPQLKIRIRTERKEWFTAYDTISERVAKIRPLGDGKYFIFAQNPDSVFTFQDDTLTEEVNLGDAEDAQNVTDAAQVGDKIYFLNNGALIAYDINPLTGTRNRTLEFIIYREGRTAQFLEGIGGKLFVILTDATRDTGKTLCVSLSGDQMLDAWTLDDAATLAWSDGTNLYVACGKDLYLAVNGTTAPVLLKSFDANVVSLSMTAAGLDNGSIWTYITGVWKEVLTGAAHNVSAITTWYGSAESLNILWGNSSEIVLYGQSTSGSYDVHRTLLGFDGATTPTGISALERYFVPDPTATGAAALMVGDERAIIGTEGGLLLMLMVSRKTNAAAWLHTTIESITSGAVPGIIPVDDEE